MRGEEKMSRIAIRTLVLGALLAAPVSLARAQTHVYTLQNTLSDLFGGPSLVADGGSLGANGYTFGADQGLSLSNVFSSGTSYSIAFNASLADLNGYRKQVDFTDRVSDDGYYAYFTQVNLYPSLFGGSAYAPNTMAFTVLTRDATTDLFSVYVDGVFEGSVIDTPGYANFTAANGIARFFEDDNATGQREASAGFVNYIATYNTALTANQVANLGMVTATPEPATIALVATGLVGVFGVARRKRGVA
jgi:hypothetical protein